MPTIKSKLDRPEKLAINLFDLDRIEPSLRGPLLSSRLDLNRPIRTNWDRAASTTDEAAVVFICDLLTAAVVCDTIRSHDRKAGDFPTRLYIQRKTWARIPSHIVLTELVDGKCKLNPSFFPEEVEAITVALSSRVVTLGR